MKTRKQLKSEIERLEMALQTEYASNDHLMKLVKEKNKEIERLKNGDCEEDCWCAYCKHSIFDGYNGAGPAYKCRKKILCKHFEEKDEGERRVSFET